MALPKDIQEARNAIKAYEQFEGWQPINEKHLLQALVAGLIDVAGRYRSGNVGVMNGEEVVHMAPPGNRVKKLMGDLFTYMKLNGDPGQRLLADWILMFGNSTYIPAMHTIISSACDIISSPKIQIVGKA